MESQRRTLYHYPLCPFSRKVRLTLFEKAIPYGAVCEIPWARRPAFLNINPWGDVPVLEEPDGHVLVNHAAICEYLNEIKPLPNLLGETPRGRAEVRRIAAWCDGDLWENVLKPIVGERVYKAVRSGENPNSALIRAGRENLKTYLSYIDWIAGRRPCLAGKNISLADISAAAHLSVLDYLGEIPWTQFPDAKLWYAKIKSRPSFNSLLQDKITAIMPAENYANLDF